MQVTIRDTGDLKKLAKQLRTVADGKELRTELTGGMRDALRPVAREVQAAYRANPGHTGRRWSTRAALPDLRQLLAKAVRLEVRTAGKFAGARIRDDGRRMPSGMRTLPKYYEGSKPRWRAPVFGNRNAWAQYRARPTFYRTVEPHADDVRKAIDGVLDNLRRRLER
jgi:hypothetical protein